MSLNIGCQTFYHLKTGSFHDSIIDIVIFFLLSLSLHASSKKSKLYWIEVWFRSLLSFQCEWCVLLTGFKRNRTFFSFFLSFFYCFLFSYLCLVFSSWTRTFDIFPNVCFVNECGLGVIASSYRWQYRILIYFLFIPFRFSL